MIDFETLKYPPAIEEFDANLDDSNQVAELLVRRIVKNELRKKEELEASQVIASAPRRSICLLVPPKDRSQ